MIISAELEARLRPIVDKFVNDRVGDLVDLLVLIADADGVIDQSERVALQAGVETIIGSSLIRSLVSSLVNESLEKIEQDGVNARAVSVGESLALANRVEDGLRAGIDVALASEGVGAVEREVLVLIARAAGTTASRVDELIAEEEAALRLNGRS